MNLGIYFHIPFCRSKCLYCHFVTVPFQRATAERYGKAVVKEMEICSWNERVDSIYFGGGTPSLGPTSLLANILTASRKHCSIADDCEISIEANPGTLSEDRISDFRELGVNRISLGAQSFDNAELSSLGRLHNADMIFESLDQLRRSGFSNINLDLMLGIPGQTPGSWRRNLETIAALDVPHISVYMLDLDDECPLQSLVAAGSVRLPDEGVVSELYLETIEYLSSRGYRQYEISNFARQDYCCRHNLKYWNRDPVLGFGLGSHSFDGRVRYANNPVIDLYLQAIERGGSAVVRREPVSALQSVEESLFLGLRLNSGVNWEQLRETCVKDRRERYENSFKKFVDEGWMERKGPVVRLTPLGMLFSNEIFQVFI